MTPLTILESERTLRLARHGRLLPWLGPALRGLAGGRLRARTCRQPVVEQLIRWRNCGSCPLMAGCGFGELYEPALDKDESPGGKDLARPLVVSPSYPVPEDGQRGQTIPVTVTFIGEKAIQHAADFWESLRLGGADLAIGLGDDHVLFDLESGPEQQLEVRLPLRPAECRGWAAWVRVELTTPLFLATRDTTKRKQRIAEPTFSDLLRASLRILGRLHRLYASPLPEQVFSQAKAAAAGVPVIHSQFTPMSQPKWSHRTKQRFDLQGICGSAVYGPLPAWLVPWLEWGGRLHVGTHRVAGAGGWSVTAV